MLFPHLFAMKWWNRMPSIISFFGCWVLSQLFFFTPLFHLHQETLSSLFSLCHRVVSSAYLNLLIFLPENLISAWASSSPAFHMMDSAYNLNKQSDNIQPWHTPFPIWNQSIVPCPVLTIASWPEYRLCRRHVRWSGIPISLRIFQVFFSLFFFFLWSTQSKILA